MAHKDWCGKPCGECQTPCELDQNMPCSPDCENMESNGTINYMKCVEVRCTVVESYVPCEGADYLCDLDNDCGCCSEMDNCGDYSYAIKLSDLFKGDVSA